MIEIFKNSLIITSFVLVMMMIIEYITIKTHGKLNEMIERSPYLQIVVSAMFGLIPGCMGSYIVVTLYMHRVVGFSALMAAMIATTGDEIFFMLSMFPNKALLLMGILFIIAIAVGIVIYWIFKNKSLMPQLENHFKFHEKEDEHHIPEKNQILNQLKHISFQRLMLIVIGFAFIFFLFSGEAEHTHILPNNIEKAIQSAGVNNHSLNAHNHDTGVDPEWNWLRISLLITTLIGLYIVITVHDHFLNEHLWDHIIKKHLLKIFLWTLGILIVIDFTICHFPFAEWMHSNQLLLLLIALAVGLIPESGPHLIFVSLFAAGATPFSILIANSLVQDGHGALPLLAESRKSFIIMKALKVFIGFVLGLAGFYFGF